MSLRPAAYLLLAGGLGCPATAQDEPPASLAVTPSSGTGASQNFQFSYSDGNGHQDIVYAQALINATSSAAGACFLRYSRDANRLYLADDTGFEWTYARSLLLDGTGTAQNSQCTISAATISLPDWDLLVVNVTVTFKPAFIGSKGIWMNAADWVGAVPLVWRGSYTVTAPPVTISAAPSSGSGATQAFQFRYADPNGHGDITHGQVIINNVLTGAGACYLTYWRGTERVYLADDAGTGWSLDRSIPLDGTGTAENSQCTLSAATRTIVDANTMTMNVTVTFKLAFVGAKSVWMYAVDAAGTVGGPDQRGAFKATAASSRNRAGRWISPARRCSSTSRGSRLKPRAG
jgi:hypothetical protein